MKIFNLTTLALSFLLLNAASCTKDNGTLPPETQEGKDTFGCLVNHQLWQNGNPPFGSSSLSAGIVKNVLSISANRDFGVSGQSISLKVNNMNGVGKYNLSGKNIGVFTELIGDTFCWFETDSLDNTSYINITYCDTLKKIVSGIFLINVKFSHSVSAVNSSDSSSIKNITEGRFDIKY